MRSSSVMVALPLLDSLSVHGSDDRSATPQLEQQLEGNQEWAIQPKPKVDYPAPKDVTDPNDDITRLELLLDLIFLAIETDSTRFVTLFVSGSNSVQPLRGVSIECHSLSHRRQDPEKLDQLKLIETRQMTAVGEFLRKLSQVKEGGSDLLRQTSVLVGNAMGNASSHNCKNLPIVLAGGGFKHGQHIGFDTENNTPLCRLYVSMLQSMVVETDQFGSGNGTLPNLELVS